jgi:uncharacterized protein (TIGR03437 family)
LFVPVRAAARPLLHLLLIAGLAGPLFVPPVSGIASKRSKNVAFASTVNWYRGATHVHTNNSDGDSSPFAVASRYKELGYNFVFLTDHNRLTDVDSLNGVLGETGQFLLIRGEEVTDSFAGKPVHINSLNNQTAVQPQHGTSVLNTIENNATAIKQAGGLPYIAHPNFGFGISVDDLQNESGTALFEIYNAHPVVNNNGDATHPSVEASWDNALSNGKLRYGIAADDEHTLSNPTGALPGRAWVMVKANSLDPSAITNAMQRGDFYASTGVYLQDYQVSSTALTIAVDTLSGPVTVDFIGKNGALLQRSTTSQSSYTFTGDEMYVRAKIVNAFGQTAWTQPIFTARLNSQNAVLNGASLGAGPQLNQPISADSIAVVSGFGLAHETRQAIRNSDNTFPTTLGNTTVTVNGRAAELYSISPTQISLHVPDETESGVATVIVTNSDGIKLQTQVVVENDAPGIFTVDGSGHGKAVTFEATRLLPKFFFPNDDSRRFYIYATGVQTDSAITVLLNGVPIAIDSVKECRHLPGLFQINVTIPSALILSSGSSLVVHADGKDSNETIFQP